jgi:hypothetical protein
MATFNSVMTLFVLWHICYAKLNQYFSTDLFVLRCSIIALPEAPSPFEAEMGRARTGERESVCETRRAGAGM